MENGLGVSSGNGTSGTTTDPQNTGQVGGNQQDPQSSVNGTSINNEGSNNTIPLQSVGQLTTASIKPATTPSHPVDAAAFIPIAVLVLAAIVLSIYFYISTKRKPKYS